MTDNARALQTEFKMTLNTARRLALLTLCGLALASPALSSPAEGDAAPKWSLAVHGGAGVLERGELTPEKDKADRAGLTPPWTPVPRS